MLLAAGSVLSHSRPIFLYTVAEVLLHSAACLAEAPLKEECIYRVTAG